MNICIAAPASGGANPLALLIAPLAGIALLTAAAAVAINPVLVTVSVTGKRRRRRDLDTVIGNNQGITPELEEKIHEMQVIIHLISVCNLNLLCEKCCLNLTPLPHDISG